MFKVWKLKLKSETNIKLEKKFYRNSKIICKSRKWRGAESLILILNNSINNFPENLPLLPQKCFNHKPYCKYTGAIEMLHHKSFSPMHFEPSTAAAFYGVNFWSKHHVTIFLWKKIHEPRHESPALVFLALLALFRQPKGYNLAWCSSF